ncbi:hypothetical protein N0V82_004119 [Gnomoniopsis sp. IMI 355080]|nr:hypothetical protein N0V82_004119 [Gnomoniopsis sp. IMI 355080]
MSSSSSKQPSRRTYDQKFDAMTLYSSFREEVLVLTPAPTLYIPPIDLSKKGSSTQCARAPVVWFPRKEAEYIQLALQTIETQDVKDELRRSYLPAPYVPCVLRSETDIVQASVLWLLHPVVKALQAQFPNVQCAAEVTVDDCRCDALISIGGRSIVVIEYKNRGNIRWSDFASGEIQDFSKNNRQAIRQRILDGRKKDEKSDMQHNAVCLTKQAAAYATKWYVRYVALFDWDHMFLWNFAGMNFQPSQSSAATRGRGGPALAPGHADWAFGTYVRDRRDYRSALLGFVMEAYRNKNSPGFKQGKWPPFELTPLERQKLQAQEDAKRQNQMTPQEKANKNFYQNLRR